MTQRVSIIKIIKELPTTRKQTVVGKTEIIENFITAVKTYLREGKLVFVPGFGTFRSRTYIKSGKNPFMGVFRTKTSSVLVRVAKKFKAELNSRAA